MLPTEKILVFPESSLNCFIALIEPVPSCVLFVVDGKKTILFPVDDRAWSESSKVDRFLVQSMRRGKKLIVTGISSPGNKVIDTYSLSGFTKALRIIDKNCS